MFVEDFVAPDLYVTDIFEFVEGVRFFGVLDDINYGGYRGYLSFPDWVSSTLGGCVWIDWRSAILTKNCAGVHRPFWIYLFVMPLLPLWAPFILFSSVAFRNSRLSRYASAASLFGCINLIVSIVFFNATVLLSKFVCPVNLCHCKLLHFYKLPLISLTCCVNTVVEPRTRMMLQANLPLTNF